MTAQKIDPNPVIVGQLDPSQANMLGQLNSMEHDDPRRSSIDYELGKLGLQGSVEGVQEFALVVTRDDADNEIPSHYVNVTSNHPSFGEAVYTPENTGLNLPDPIVGQGKLKWRQDMLDMESQKRMAEANEPNPLEKAYQAAGKYIGIATEIYKTNSGDPLSSDLKLAEMIQRAPMEQIDRVTATAVAAGAVYSNPDRINLIRELVDTGMMSIEDANILNTLGESLLQLRANVSDVSSRGPQVQSYIVNVLQDIPSDNKMLQVAVLSAGAGATIGNDMISDSFLNRIQTEVR